MEPIKLLSLTGFILVIAGIALMVARFGFPAHFAGIYKEFAGLGLTLRTNEVGFGVIVIGVVLMLFAATLSKRTRTPRP